MPNYLELALQTQRFSFERLGYLGGAASCAAARYLSYRCSDVEPRWADLWYIATQVGADAALLQAGVEPEAGRLEKTGACLDHYWDEAAGPGYLARGNPDMGTFLGPDKYCDDHGHLGLMMLDAYAATGAPAWLARARRAAEFLLDGGVWDDTFGGGYWWNTKRGANPEGKPAQANGLAVGLFAELYGQTGEARYRDQALRTLDWLEARLYDSAAGLYRWSVAFRDRERWRGEVLSGAFFNYDQGIIVEALLALDRHVAPDPAYLARARSIAERLEAAFWAPEPGGFTLQAGGAHVFTIYSAWLTPSLLALDAVDPDARWPALARRNVDALNAYLRAPDGGYFKSARREGDGWALDRTRDGVANAGMQWAQARLAAHRAG